ncbi:MAG: hypothetical protein ABIX01_09800 [Chitinophagaceae bacterium]
MKNILLASAVCFLCSCAPTRFVKPLAKKQQAVNFSLGGPVIDYKSVPIPMPFITATYGYGIDSSLTGFASLNITSALYGNLQLELGATKQLLKQKGGIPAISINPVLNIIYRKNEARLYPQLDVNAFWDHNNGRSFFYVGLCNWFELQSKRTLDEDQPHHWILTPMIGETLVRKKWNYNIEAKMVAANVSNASVVDYKSLINKHGAFGIYFGVTRKF